MFSDYSTVEEIFPNLYPSMDSAINLLLYTDKGYTDVMVTAEIAGFTQKYEQKVTLTPEMTYLMIKPPGAHRYARPFNDEGHADDAACGKHDHGRGDYSGDEEH